MTSETVWVIEQGSYSDYRVVGVFSSRENAERVAAKLNESEYSYDKAEVAEWPLNPGIEALNQNLVRHRVLMLRDGGVEEVRALDGWSSYELDGSVRVWPRSTAPAYRGKGIPDVLDATVWARDSEHAVKITNERRLQMIAGNQWSEATP